MDCLSPEVQNQPRQHGEILSLQKIQKISQVWWCRPVVPAPGEAKAGGSHSPGRSRLQWAMFVATNYTPAWVTEWDSVIHSFIYIYSCIHTYKLLLYTVLTITGSVQWMFPSEDEDHYKQLWWDHADTMPLLSKPWIQLLKATKIRYSMRQCLYHEVKICIM